MTSRADLAARINEVARLSGTFTLRSGATSETYFDKYLFESDPALLRAICEEMATLLPSQTTLLAGLEMGGIPVVSVLSQVTGLPAAYIRKEAKPYGTCKYAEGPAFGGEQVAIVEDVVSSGGAILDALEKLEVDEVRPVGILCVIDRQTGGSSALAKRGYELRSVLTMQEIERDG
jgi:orotate phosphoribosyltransferase